MYHITGFSHGDIIDLCILINSAERDRGFAKWPPILGLFKSVAVTLTYMRHNRTQAEIAESFGVSQPTIGYPVTEPAQLALDPDHTPPGVLPGTCHMLRKCPASCEFSC